MRAIRALALAGALFAALAPEFRRYSPAFLRERSAEREIRVASGAFRIVVSRPQEVSDPAGALSRIADIALSAASKVPADPRPRILAGSAKLVSGDASGALEEYRLARSLGERAETDLNIARAYDALGEVEKARAAYVRAAWISPALLALLLPDVAEPIGREVARLEAQLKAGRLKQPPPMPE
jgi:tetratricopeptide (TPR) repeat protein